MNVWLTVQVFGFARFRPIVLAVPPLYVPENVRVEFVAVRSARFDPREIPEMVEFARPALLRVPVIVGVRVRAPAVGTMFCPTVNPLNESVDVEKVTAVCVVDA